MGLAGCAGQQSAGQATELTSALGCEDTLSVPNYESWTFAKPRQKLENLIAAQSHFAALVGTIVNRNFYGTAAPFLERDHIGVAAI
jgi:hypothetical protein